MTNKEQALNNYKTAKANYMNTMDKADWITFCDAKKVCMMLGIRI